MFSLLPSAPNLLYTLPTPLRSLGEVGPWGPEQQGPFTLWLLVGFAQLGASTGDWREEEK